MGKNFVQCIYCENLNLCETAKIRLEGLDTRMASAQDIGCFGYEQYKNQTEPKQKKLF